MDGIFFFLIALVVIFLSIKIAHYADILNKTTKIGGALIGGIFLAGITSLPEMVACISAIYMNNPYLTVGNILGSNVFNIFFMCVFDLFLIKKTIFNNTSRKYYYIFLMLLINYFFLYLTFNGYLSNTIFNIGIPTLVILIVYGLYIAKVSKTKEESNVRAIKEKFVWLKFIICSVAMVFFSILLTFIANHISISNPSFSGSFIGAVLLGVVTSLPEIITFYKLIQLNNYNLALSDIVGSNLFNLLVLAVGDFIVRGRTLYFYTDLDSNLLLKLATITTCLSFYQNMRKRCKNKIRYILPSIIIVGLYLYFLIVQFK